MFGYKSATQLHDLNVITKLVTTLGYIHLKVNKLQSWKACKSKGMGFIDIFML